MKKLIAFTIVAISIGGLLSLIQKVQLGFMPIARAQSGAKPGAPSDMPIPPELLDGGNAAAPVSKGATPPAPSAPPAPPVPQKGLPMDLKGAALTPVLPAQDIPPSGLPTPQDLDPSLKFLSSQEFVYDPTGRRDPFKSYLNMPKNIVVEAKPSLNSSSGIPSYLQQQNDQAETPESYGLDKLSVAAILWDVSDPKALIKGPGSKTFMVHKHTRIGKNSGYIAAIREGEVVVVEIAPDGRTPMSRVMVLQQ